MEKIENTPILGPGMAIAASLKNYRKRFGKIMIVLGLPAFLLFFLEALVARFLEGNPIVRLAMMYVLTIPMEVALMHLFAAEFETDGESALSTYGKTVGKWPRVFVVSILQISVFIPIILFAAGGMKNTILCLPMLVGIILIGYLSIRLTLMIPEIVVGDAGLADAVKDSWRKTGGNFWVIFAINLFSGLLSALLVTLPLTVVGTVISNGAADPAVSKALGNIFDDLANILILPFSICIQLVIYYQLTFDDQHRRDLPVTDPIASEGLENEAGGENPPSRNRRKSSARKAPPGRGSRPGVKRNRGE